MPREATCAGSVRPHDPDVGVPKDVADVCALKDDRNPVGRPHGVRVVSATRTEPTQSAAISPDDEDGGLCYGAAEIGADLDRRTKARRRPSGDQTGSSSKAGSVVTLRRPVPSLPMTEMSPTYEVDEGNQLHVGHSGAGS